MTENTVPGLLGRAFVTVLASVSFVLVCFGCSAPGQATAILRDVSGVARAADELLIVDDETPGAYFRFLLPSDPPRVFDLHSDQLARTKLPGANLALDAEAIAVLNDGRVVVLSERLRGLVGSDGLLVEYPVAFSEFGTRGLE